MEFGFYGGVNLVRESWLSIYFRSFGFGKVVLRRALFRSSLEG